MLVTLVAGYRGQNQEVDRYAGWGAAVRRLRDNWGEGQRPTARQLPDYLQDLPEDQRAGALLDLIAEHLSLAWQAGRGTLLDSYLQELGQQLADSASPAAVPADLVEDEFLARYLRPHGDTPCPDDYARGFPGRTDVQALLQPRCLDGGRYVKLHKRGQGAMGEVWEAYDHHLRRLVAIKEPKAAQAKNADVLRRFAEEAHLTAGLEHPGIASVHEFQHQEDAAPFYVMRLVTGQNLSERLRAYHLPPMEREPGKQRLLWHRLLQAFVSTCDALSYAHAQGVLHRDLKPGNIVIGDFGETVILDWGAGQRLARGSAAAAGDKPTGLVVGTPQYMPPEQAGGQADRRSDVFGLGAVLYEMLAAQPPHPWTEGARPADWLRLVREAQFPPPGKVKTSVPPALEAICLKALARKPADRYQSAAELAQEIRCYLGGEPVSVWSESLSAKVWRWFGGGGR